MKIKLLVLSIIIIFPLIIKAQIIDTNNIKPEEIPSPEILKKMGVADPLIKKIMDYKFRSINKIQPVKTDTTKKTTRFKPIINTDSALFSIDTTQFIAYPPANIYGQDLFRNKNINFFEKSSRQKAPDNYILGIGDELSISIWGFAEYNETFQINEDGFISPKYTGRVYLKGLKFANAKSILIKKFSQITDLKNSNIDINITYSRIIRVNIVGEVYNPGSYNIPANNTAFNALVAAAGPTQIGSVRNIYIKRNNKIIDSLDVYKFLYEPATQNDIFLDNNDYIIVKPAGSTVTITGEIQRPYKYEIKHNESLTSLIKYSGGLLATSYASNIQLKRYINNKLVLQDVNLDSLLKNKVDFRLQNGDLIFIGKLPKDIDNIVSVTGAINIPGTYEFKTGDKVFDLLKKAQGTAINAYLSLAYIIRQKDEMTKKYISFNLKNVINNSDSPDNILLQKYDTLKILSNSDFLDNYKITIYGSVRKPGDYFYGENLSLRDAILLAGGLKQEAATNRIEISRIIDYNEKNNIITPQRAIVFSTQVNVDLTLNEQSNIFQLQPFDLVFIRENPDFEIPKTVILIGEVTYPGVYSLVKKDETVASLIKRAGGLSQYAYVDGVTMNRKFEETGLVYINLAKALKREHSKYNIVLNDSDEIYIPKVIDLVRISGAIGNVNFKSISAPYFGKKRAKYYIKNFAGGFNKDCEKAKTFVIYPNGIMKKTKNFGLIRFYPKVRNGSNVHLSFKEVKPDDKAQKAPVDWNKIIENTTIKITGLLTLWLLVTKIQ